MGDWIHDMLPGPRTDIPVFGIKRLNVHGGGAATCATLLRCAHPHPFAAFRLPLLAEYLTLEECGRLQADGARGNSRGTHGRTNGK